MKGTGAKRFFPGSCVSTGAKFPVAPVESAPMLVKVWAARPPVTRLLARALAWKTNLRLSCIVTTSPARRQRHCRRRPCTSTEQNAADAAAAAGHALRQSSFELSLSSWQPLTCKCHKHLQKLSKLLYSQTDEFTIFRRLE